MTVLWPALSMVTPLAANPEWKSRNIRIHSGQSMPCLIYGYLKSNLWLHPLAANPEGTPRNLGIHSGQSMLWLIYGYRKSNIWLALSMVKPLAANPERKPRNVGIHSIIYGRHYLWLHPLPRSLMENLEIYSILRYVSIYNIFTPLSIFHS